MAKLIIGSGPVIVENKKVLLNRDRKDSFWKFCGGQVEESEHCLKAVAQREAKEEMGIDLEFADNDPFLYYVKKDDDVSVILAHFLAKRVGDIKAGPDTIEWSWISIDDLQSHDLAPNIIPALKHFSYIN